MNPKFERLREIWAEASDLSAASAVLGWDEQCYMPPGGAAARAQQLATLRRLVHERIASDEVGKLLEELVPLAQEWDYDGFEASFVRAAKRDYDRLKKIPQRLVTEWTLARSEAFHAWLEARKERRFALFQRPLERLVQIQFEVTDALGYEDRRFDALLDLHEPDMKTRDVEALFTALRRELVPLVRAISERQDRVSDAILRQHFPDRAQWDFSMEVLEAVGFDLRRGRQDRSPHPFTTSFSPGDVRVTTRINEDYFPEGLYGTIHEAGHGMYEQGIPAEFFRTPLANGASGGVHESQSRLWENIVGRSRGFWEHFLPRAKTYFPTQFAEATVEDLYRAVNKAEPSLIRTEADEVTYNLHIMVRFELENAVLDRKLAVADLRDAWNAKYQEYLGVAPAHDTEGVLQDIHWTGGFAGFPGYTLGNVIGVQLYERALADHPAIPDQIRRGEFGTLSEWMRSHVYVHGAKYTPPELLQRAVGGPLDPGPYLRYIKTKYAELYGL